MRGIAIIAALSLVGIGDGKCPFGFGSKKPSMAKTKIQIHADAAGMCAYAGLLKPVAPTPLPKPKPDPDAGQHGNAGSVSQEVKPQEAKCNKPACGPSCPCSDRCDCQTGECVGMTLTAPQPKRDCDEKGCRIVPADQREKPSPLPSLRKKQEPPKQNLNRQNDSGGCSNGSCLQPRLFPRLFRWLR